MDGCEKIGPKLFDADKTIGGLEACVLPMIAFATFVVEPDDADVTYVLIMPSFRSIGGVMLDSTVRELHIDEFTERAAFTCTPRSGFYERIAVRFAFA